MAGLTDGEMTWRVHEGLAEPKLRAAMLIKSTGSLADYKSFLLDIQGDLKEANDAKFRNVKKIAQNTASNKNSTSATVEHCGESG